MRWMLDDGSLARRTVRSSQGGNLVGPGSDGVSADRRHVVGAEEVFRDRAVEIHDLDVRIGFELPDERLELEDHLRVDFVEGRVVERDQPQLGTFDGDGEAVGHGGLLVCLGIRVAPGLVP